MQPIEATGYFFLTAGERLERRVFAIDAPAPDEAVVEVSGCGLCHTDLSFMSGGVKTKHPLPLVLGHEISGRVVQAGSAFQGLVGASVIVPAVLPCGKCSLCEHERDNICQHQKMPGNDFHGGFATHVKVPAAFLCRLPEDLRGFGLADLSVIADAVTTPYQSLVRSKLAKGDVAIVIGAGGIGTYMVQHARNAGAVVIALDLDDAKLERAKSQGAAHVLNTKGLDESAIKKELRGLVQKAGLPQYEWKVFETSGSAAGQALGFSLLTYAGVLGIVGFTMEKLSLRLSNVMAFDADVFGNWGCRPTHYRTVVDDVLAGRVNLLDNVERFKLDQINDVIALATAHKLAKRAVLVP
jgi:6-hydroxycyclohex-1-ene-1-carbonyl-CoA dehydrogenase